MFRYILTAVVSRFEYFRFKLFPKHNLVVELRTNTFETTKPILAFTVILQYFPKRSI